MRDSDQPAEAVETGAGPAEAESDTMPSAQRARPLVPLAGLVLGCTLATAAVQAPLGAKTAYAYRSLQFERSSGSEPCPQAGRGEAVSVWPARSEAGVRRARLVSSPDCTVPLSLLSARPRPALRPAPEGELHFARLPGAKSKRARFPRRYLAVNARSEPELDEQNIVANLESFDAVAQVAGIVTGSDGLDWVEVRLTTGATAYIKYNRVEFGSR